MTLTSRERVRRTLNRQPVDRPPIDLGGSAATGMDATTYGEFLLRLNVVEKPAINADAFSGLVYTDDYGLFRRLGSDVLPVPWGVFLPGANRRSKPGIKSKDDLKPYFDSLPRHRTEECIARDVERARQLHEENRYALFGNMPVSIFQAWEHRGLETFLADLLERPGFARALMEAHAEYWLEFWRPAMEAVGGLLDVVWVADDLGGRDAPLISPALYRERVKPIHCEVWTEVKRRAPNARLMLHSDGAVEPLLRDFIECGVEILNPVDHTARGMEAAHLKREYGQELIFWGGGIEAGLLQRGSPEEVRRAVRRNIDVLGAGGGYVFAAIGEILPETPAENILAAFEEAARPAAA